MSKAPVVIVSGQVAAGKTTAAKMLQEDGFQYARISQVIKTRWDRTLGPKPPRSWYQRMGMKLHHDIGQSALCEETLALIANPAASFVIDGARWKEDVAFFQDRFGERVIHLHLEAPADVRKRRFEAREKDVCFEDADRDEVESEVDSLARQADAVFENHLDEPERLLAFIECALRGEDDAS